MNRQIYESSASVQLDGSALRRLREERRLTQLYVSKVVGVTTDTVSRWENNRYPTMRRENALKLAEALEVPLDELLLKPAVPTAPVTAPRRSQLPLVLVSLLAVVVSLALLAVLWHSQRQALPVPVTAERLLPPHAAPRSDLPVRLLLTRRGEEGGFIVKEYLPRGWKLLQADPPPSSLDNETGMVRWIIKAGDERERIVYLAQPPAAQVGSVAVFQGEVIAGPAEGKNSMAVQGGDRVRIATLLWADLDGSGRIDDGEMLQASHTVDEMAGVKIDWEELERLWSAGGYRWDEAGRRFIPSPSLPGEPAGRP